MQNSSQFKSDRIYTSSDYDRFRFKEGNRDIADNHVREIAQSMRDRGWFGGPIEVSLDQNGNFIVEEGQHRVKAAKMSYTPIRFIVVESRNIFETSVQNSLTKKWTVMDYITSHAREGNVSYKRLKNVIDRFPEFNPTEIMWIAGIEHKDNFKKGYVRFSEETQARVIKTLEQMKEIRRVLKEIDMAQSSYTKVISVLIMNDLIDPDRMAKKIAKYGQGIMLPVRRADLAVDYIERVYNFAQRDPVFLVSEYRRLTRKTTVV